jgi:NitT/TauT family transport system ATP-binding protein
MTTPVRIGFIPLMDAALLLAAERQGFAEQEGLALTLVRDVSWANLRDKLNLGYLDAAHMLAPAAIASSLGLGHVRVDTIAPLALSLNGNAITLSLALYNALAEEADGHLASPKVSAQALRRVIDQRAAAGQGRLTFGHVFPFSSHHYQLRAWMNLGSVDPDEDLNLVVIPPPYMARSLATGQLDGFCVGAPWNSLAVLEGHGRILHAGSEIVARCPEKVLALRREWDEAHADTTDRLIRAIQAAAEWAAREANRDSLASLLSDPAAIDVPPAVARSILDGRLTVAPGVERESPDYLCIGPADTRPQPAHAAWVFDQMVASGQASDVPVLRERALAVYRPDRYAQSLGHD